MKYVTQPSQNTRFQPPNFIYLFFQTVPSFRKMYKYPRKKIYTYTVQVGSFWRLRRWLFEIDGQLNLTTLVYSSNVAESVFETEISDERASRTWCSCFIIFITWTKVSPLCIYCINGICCVCGVRIRNSWSFTCNWKWNIT